MKKDRHIRAVSFFCLMLLAVFCLTACGREEEPIAYDSSRAAGLGQAVISIYDEMAPAQAEQYLSLDEEQLSGLEESLDEHLRGYFGGGVTGQAFQTGLGSFRSALESLGSIKEVGEPDIRSDADTIYMNLKLRGTEPMPGGGDRTAQAEFMMSRSYTITDIVVNVDRTFGEKMQNAALNTLLGMGTTFAVLIFITLIIYLMGYIVRELQKEKQKPAPATSQAAATEAVPADEEEEAEAVSAGERADDAALAAVIAAAIAAYESGRQGREITPETFIVRSLKRR